MNLNVAQTAAQKWTVMPMSKPRYGWWSYVKSMIRRYPSLKIQHDLMRYPSISSQITGMPRGGNGKGSDPTAASALRELPPIQQKEYEAVRDAVTYTYSLPNGPDRIKVIQLVFWDKTHTINGAAMKIPCSDISAKRWHGEFIRLVAQNFGLMPKDDTPEPKK